MAPSEARSEEEEMEPGPTEIVQSLWLMSKNLGQKEKAVVPWASEE